MSRVQEGSIDSDRECLQVRERQFHLELEHLPLRLDTDTKIRCLNPIMRQEMDGEMVFIGFKLSLMHTAT